jgi:hypothetical protein
MCRNRRRIRRWASWVVFAWLFGLGMGVVNACALVDAVPGATVAHTEHHPVDHDDDQHGDKSLGHDKSNCLEFCALSSIGAPVVKVAPDSPLQADLPALPSAFQAYSATTQAEAGPAPSPPAGRRGSPPLRIAYQRLAL